jgi:hypothetical protein
MRSQICAVVVALTLCVLGTFAGEAKAQPFYRGYGVYYAGPAYYPSYGGYYAGPAYYSSYGRYYGSYYPNYGSGYYGYYPTGVSVYTSPYYGTAVNVGVGRFRFSYSSNPGYVGVYWR